LHLFTEEMLLSFLIADQLMIYLLANYFFFGGGRNSAFCEFSSGKIVVPVQVICGTGGGPGKSLII